jgi:hypothetical protein
MSYDPRAAFKKTTALRLIGTGRIYAGLKSLVVDAVVYEPVSTPKFPDMREFAGNFFNLQGICLEMQSKRCAESARCDEIPYATKQGIFLRESGKLATGARNSAQH